MTLAQRNRYFKGGIILSSLCFLTLASFAGKLLPFYPDLSAAALHRSGGAFQALAAKFFDPSPYAPFVTMTLAVIYSLSASILIFVFFEKTQSPEILFFGLFALSFVFEIFRIMPPLQRLYGFPSVLLVWGARMLIFGRLLGVISLFASSVYAAGLETQKQGRVVITMVMAILVISIRIPVNGLAWDSSFTMIFAYGSMFRFAEDALLVITVVSFLVSAYTRGNGEYLLIALGVFLAALGRGLVIGADTWITPLPGSIMLIAGTWIVTARLHQVYLWL
ncbi:MAG: hypothetical protein LBC31_02180 [Treponema sp.]|jgi:hypothetical protein|nr:hypothetical protein [Treponema sp.]